MSLSILQVVDANDDQATGLLALGIELLGQNPSNLAGRDNALHSLRDGGRIAGQFAVTKGCEGGVGNIDKDRIVGGSEARNVGGKLDGIHRSAPADFGLTEVSGEAKTLTRAGVRAPVAACIGLQADIVFNAATQPKNRSDTGAAHAMTRPDATRAANWWSASAP